MPALNHTSELSASEALEILRSHILVDGFPIVLDLEACHGCYLHDALSDEEYLDFYVTPGVQHIAMATGDILATVKKLQRNGIQFLRVPDTYYDILPDRIGPAEARLREMPF